jgi:hypothetical protein
MFKSITGGITKTVDQFGKVIVVEDDVLVSPGFLKYMNDALDLYANTHQVMHISGFSREEFKAVPLETSTYFFYHTTCWDGLHGKGHGINLYQMRFQLSVL